MAWLEQLGSSFREDAYGVFVYWDDNGDGDGTRAALRGWAQRNRQVHLVLAPPLRSPAYYRTQRLALCRNVLLGEGLLRLPPHGTLAFYDLDCKVASTAPALAAARMLAQPLSPWSVLTANSPGAYYDQWALRSSLSKVGKWPLGGATARQPGLLGRFRRVLDCSARSRREPKPLRIFTGGV